MTETLAIRAVGETDEAWLYEGLAIPYSGPMNGQDLTGTHFTRSTDLCEDWFPTNGRPILYGHGFDPELGTEVVGRDLSVRESPEGKWITFQIDKAKRYASEIRELAEAGVLALSSAAVDHLVTISAKGGEIVRWPWVETSLVPNPANPEALIRTVKSAEAVEHLAVVGSSVRELEIEISEAEPEDPAEHAKAGAHVLACLADLIAEEADEPEQVAILTRAVAAVQEWIAAEIAEIGSGIEETEDNNDAPAATGSDSSGEGGAAASVPATVLAVSAGNGAEMVPVADLDSVREAAVALAVREALSILGR